jgi:hypothetical protein
MKFGPLEALAGKACPLVGGACAAPACAFYVHERNDETSGMCLQLAAFGAQVQSSRRSPK